MTTAARFGTAWRRRDGAVELLPDQLAQAAAEVLGVPGVGISVFTTDGFRVPLGASDATASAAERLQFTHGAGPCLAAIGVARTVHVPEAEFARVWPTLFAEFEKRTPFRSAVAVPMRYGPNAVGAYDLYLDDPGGGVELPDADLDAVRDGIVSAVAEAIAHSRMPPGSDWLSRPGPRRRTDVWIALGVLNAALALPAPDALARIRAFAYARDLAVDDVAQALVSRQLDPVALTV